MCRKLKKGGYPGILKIKMDLNSFYASLIGSKTLVFSLISN